MRHDRPPDPHELDRRRRRAHRGAAAGAAARERELKFHVPPQVREALAREFAGPDSRLLPLQAVYHDTADGALRRAGASLRVRREGRRWVQTFKAAGAHPWERIEDNVDVPRVRAGSTPRVDPARHRDPGIREALDRALGDGDARAVLEPAFEVAVRRRSRQVRHEGSLVEIALDEGELKAAGRTQAILELEFELVAGDESDLVAVAQAWCSRWGLTLQLASKAARGFHLLAGDRHGPPVKAPDVAVARQAEMGEFAAAVLQSCLHQVVANADGVVAGSASGEHIHQLRVGLRRLRTALRELPPLAAERERHEAALAGVFRGLGERRDRDHVLRSIAPCVEAAGGPPLRVPAGFHDGPDPAALVQQPAFQAALLDLLACAHGLRREGGSGVRRSLRPRLARLHRALVRDGRRFADLAPPQQHRVRKRLKRLRYLCEFLAPVFGHAATRDYLAVLEPAQDALGAFNDEAMAQGLYEELAGSDPDARFGARWLDARRAAHAKACRKALRKLEAIRPFWDER